MGYSIYADCNKRKHERRDVSFTRRRKDKVDLMPLQQVVCPSKLSIRAQGMLDTLCVEMDDTSASDLGDDELEIEVKATGLE